MKVNKFLKLGFVSLVGALVIGNSAFAHEHHEPVNQQQMEKIVHKNSDAQENKFINNVIKKYELETNNIHLKAIRFDKDLPVSWGYSTARDNADGSVDVIIVLDKNGDLYNIDKDFTGKNKLTQEEKNIIKEQTILHEYMHAHARKETNFFKSSRLSSSENIAMNEAFFKGISSLIKFVYNETQAAAGANLLLIKHNPEKIQDIQNVLKKMSNLQDKSSDKYYNTHQQMETHIMMSESNKIVLNDLKNNPDFLKHKSFEEVINYSQQISSDLSLDYLAQFGKQFKIEESLNDVEYIKEVLFATVKDIVQPETIKRGANTVLFKSKAKDLIENFPQLKDENALGKKSYSPNLNTINKIIVEASNTQLPEDYDLVLGRKFKLKDEFNQQLQEKAQEISQQANFILAKKIAMDYINKSPYMIKSIKTPLEASSITSKIYSMRQKFEQQETKLADNNNYKIRYN